MVPTTFGRELLGRDVVDASNDKLGTMADFSVDMDTGSIVSLLVVIDQGIDPKFLPWPTTEGLLSVPVSEVAKIGSAIQLTR